MRFGLFRSRSVSGANLVMFLVGAAFFSMWYFLSLYLQNVLGFSALKTGLAFLPMGVTIIIGAQASSRIMPRTGVRPLLLAGTVLAACGFAWLSAISPDSSYWAHVFGPGCLIALALGLLFTPLASAATTGVALPTPDWPRACSTPRGRSAVPSAWRCWPPSRPTGRTRRWPPATAVSP